MTNNVELFTEAQLRDQMHLDLSIVDVVEAAFLALENGEAIMPPILSMDIPTENAEVDVKTAYVAGMQGFAIKISTGFFNNPKLGLPSLNGLMVMLNAQTGQVMAVFLDNGYLTDLRTAAAGVVASRYLAPTNVHTTTVFGTGVQARLQVQAAHLVRPFERVTVWGRDMAKAEGTARDLQDALGVRATPTDDREVAIAASQLLITTTPAREPIVHADWLHPNLHITAMGSDQSGKNEIDPVASSRVDLYVADRIAQTKILGELRALDAAGLPRPPTAELGAVIKGNAKRTDDAQITFADLTGTGVQDTAIANAVMAKLRGQGIIIQN